MTRPAWSATWTPQTWFVVLTGIASWVVVGVWLLGYLVTGDLRWTQ